VSTYSVCVRVCVCACVRERDRETERQSVCLRGVRFIVLCTQLECVCVCERESVCIIRVCIRLSRGIC